MARAADKLWTLEEFLAFDDGTEISYQLFEGRIVAMNPPLRGHGALVVRLADRISSQLKPPCEAYRGSGHRPGQSAAQLVQGGPDRHLHARQLQGPVHRRAGAGDRGALADHDRDRFQPQAPGLSANSNDAGRAAGLQHGAADPTLVARAEGLDGAPASARGHGSADRPAGHLRAARPVRRHPARVRRRRRAAGRHP